MGREIRRVPPNWEHPRYTEEDAPYNPLRSRVGEFRSLFDRSFSVAEREWLDECRAWYDGTDPDRAEHPDMPYWEWNGNPPDRASYRPDWPEGEATWFQAYENVSEGTPISPPFATEDELIHWLATQKDYWGQGPRSRENAERFVRGGWAPSMVIIDGQIGRDIDALGLIAETHNGDAP